MRKRIKNDDKKGDEKREEKGDVGWLVGWLDLWHINLCMLFNAKSMFIYKSSSISNNLV